MRGELMIGDKVSVHVREAYQIYGIIEGIIIGVGYKEYFICGQRYQDTYHSKIESCCKQEISDYFLN